MRLTIRPWPSALFGLMLAILWPALAAADDLDVTMRMVMDDEELSGELIQEIELPDPVSLELRGLDPVHEMGLDELSLGAESEDLLGEVDLLDSALDDLTDDLRDLLDLESDLLDGSGGLLDEELEGALEDLTDPLLP